MSKSVFKIDLSKSVIADLEKEVEAVIPQDQRTKASRMFVMDSYDGGSVLLGIIFEIINSKAACAAIAGVLIAWIQTRNGKKIIIKKDGVKIEASNLTQKQLEDMLEKGSKLVIDTEKETE